jgi:hypothetical protein
MNILETHERIRQILIDYNCEEYEDSIIDEICQAVNYPTTVDFEAMSKTEIKPLKFTEQTVEEFNLYQDTFLTEDMTFAEAIDVIEECDNNYFYVSTTEEDVQEAYENEYDIAIQLQLDPVYIKELGIYIALQP